MEKEETKRRFYQKNWFAILMLFLFFPVGLWLLWKCSSYSKRTKTYITIAFFAFVAISNVTNPRSKTATNTAQVTTKQEVAEVKQSSISKQISRELKSTPEQANQIEQILKQCGITGVNSIKHREDSDMENEKMYELSVNDGYRGFIYTDENNNLTAVRYASQNLYKEGAFLATVSDYHLTFDDKQKYQMVCQKTVESLLKAPKTAEFASDSEWNFSKNKEAIKVSAY